MVQFDSRKDHFVTNIMESERYSIVYYKSYDVRYDHQTIFTGVEHTHKHKLIQLRP